MTVESEIADPDVPSPETSPAGTHVKWRYAFREFVLIVAGVLAALAGNAWWQSRSDAARETAYIVQIRRDLAALNSRLDSAIAATTKARDRAHHMSQFLQSTGTLPPQDSIEAWSKASVASVLLPTAATLQALIGSGDFRLVRNDSLRAALISYAGVVGERTSFLATTRGVFLERSSRSRQTLEPYKVYAPSEWTDSASTVREFRADAMRRDPTLRVAFIDLGTSYGTERATWLTIQKATATLIRQMAQFAPAK